MTTLYSFLPIDFFYMYNIFKAAENILLLMFIKCVLWAMVKLEIKSMDSKKAMKINNYQPKMENKDCIKGDMIKSIQILFHDIAALKKIGCSLMILLVLVAVDI